MEITNSDLTKIFDIAFEYPDFSFIIGTKHTDKVKKFVKKHACVESFGWIPEQCHIFKYGDLIHFDDILMRNECGYKADCGKSCKNCDGESYCEYPNDTDSEEKICGKRLCATWNCPIANPNPHKDILEKNDLANQYEYDEEDYSIDCNWMELFKRPKDAAVDNVIVKER